MALLELEGLDQNVYVIVPDLRDDRFVGVDPHASHARLLSHVGFAVEPAGSGWSPWLTALLDTTQDSMIVHRHMQCTSLPRVCQYRVSYEHVLGRVLGSSVWLLHTTYNNACTLQQFGTYHSDTFLRETKRHHTTTVVPTRRKPIPLFVLHVL